MALMFNHAVKYKGRFYPANTPIEEPAQAAENPPQDVPEAPVEEITEEPTKPVKRAVRGRKKGDA